jgi:hypothetical protein
MKKVGNHKSTSRNVFLSLALMLAFPSLQLHKRLPQPLLLLK